MNVRQAWLLALLIQPLGWLVVLGCAYLVAKGLAHTTFLTRRKESTWQR